MPSTRRSQLKALNVAIDIGGSFTKAAFCPENGDILQAEAFRIGDDANPFQLPTIASLGSRTGHHKFGNDLTERDEPFGGSIKLILASDDLAVEYQRHLLEHFILDQNRAEQESIFNGFVGHLAHKLLPLIKAQGGYIKRLAATIPVFLIGTEAKHKLDWFEEILQSHFNPKDGVSFVLECEAAFMAYAVRMSRKLDLEQSKEVLIVDGGGYSYELRRMKLDIASNAAAQDDPTQISLIDNTPRGLKRSFQGGGSCLDILIQQRILQYIIDLGLQSPENDRFLFNQLWASFAAQRETIRMGRVGCLWLTCALHGQVQEPLLIEEEDIKTVLKNSIDEPIAAFAPFIKNEQQIIVTGGTFRLPYAREVLKSQFGNNATVIIRLEEQDEMKRTYYSTTLVSFGALCCLLTLKTDISERFQEMSFAIDIGGHRSLCKNSQGRKLRFEHSSTEADKAKLVAKRFRTYYDLFQFPISPGTTTIELSLEDSSIIIVSGVLKTVYNCYIGECNQILVELPPDNEDDQARECIYISNGDKTDEDDIVYESSMFSSSEEDSSSVF